MPRAPRTKRTPNTVSDFNSSSKVLQAQPQVTRIEPPKISEIDMSSYAGVIDAFKAPIAYLAMEQLFTGLQTNAPEGRELLRTMAPYMFRKQAQVIETKNLDGEISEDAAKGIHQLLQDEEID